MLNQIRQTIELSEYDFGARIYNYKVGAKAV